MDLNLRLLYLWMVVGTASGFLVGVLCGQTTEVEQVQYLEADGASVTDAPDGGVLVLVRGLKPNAKAGVIIRPKVTGPLVRAYSEKTPFPPQTLAPVEDGFLLIGPPGSKWTIEVLALENGIWFSEYLQITIKGGNGPQPPPDEPPSGDWDELKRLSASLATKVNDPPTRQALAEALGDVVRFLQDDTGVGLADAQKLVIQARQRVFLHRNNKTKNWTNWVRAVEAYLGDSEIKNRAQYLAALSAIVKGLASD